MSRKKVYLLVLLVLLGEVAISSSYPVTKNEAEKIIENAKKIIPKDPTILAIFGNNISIALLMLIPIIGVIIGTYALFNTGLIFAATGVTNGIPGIFLILVTSILPFFWFEFLAYAAAITQGLYLIWVVRKRNFKVEAKNTIITIAVVAALLFIGAFIETLLIQR